MIESILIKNIASYDNSGIQINDLKKINFIYGANGSGKTTISNLLINQANPLQYPDCNVKWENSNELQCLVYNNKFREDNFGKGTIEGVFTLGSATKEDIKIIEKKQNELSELKVEISTKKKTIAAQQDKKDEVENTFKENAWKKIYKKNESNFKEAFKGSMQKEKFKTKFLEEFKTNTSDLITFDELIEKSKTIFGEAPESLPYKKSISFDKIIEIENESVWKDKIIGKSDVDIAQLIQKLNVNDWVNQGRKYLQDDTICPFCQQPTITAEFKAKLESYFDESFTTSIEQINLLEEEYKLLTNNLINELKETENSEKLNKNTKLNTETFTAYINSLSSQFISNIDRLKNKIKEPSRIISLTSTEAQLDLIKNLLANANNEIKKHNEIVNNYQTEKTNLISNIWKYLIEEFKEDIETFNKTNIGLQSGIANLTTQEKAKSKLYTDTSNEIKDLSNNVTSIEPTINQINTTLKKFGFLNFEIVPSENVTNHYQLQRENGALVESSLSEGEITFITFLYFMQLAKGATNKEEVSTERVLIVDDPISSLDSTILFVVSTLLKGIIKNIKKGTGNVKQLTILTHNVYFHKEASFVNGREEHNNDTNHWILRKKDKVSTIQAFGKKNPIKTSYELLWEELKNKDYTSGISIQNTMRRIIENYFKILGKYGDDELIQHFTTIEEQEICRSLICWINDGSHSIADDLFIELQDDSTDSYLKVFEDIFKLTNHTGHYNMMMGIKN